MSKPELEAFTVINREGEKGYWLKIGAAWRNRDGSLTVVMQAAPLDGRLVLRPPYEEGEQNERERGRGERGRSERGGRGGRGERGGRRPPSEAAPRRDDSSDDDSPDSDDVPF